jgi:hypothetical protein
VSNSGISQAALNELAAALVERLEEVEQLAIKTLPKSSRASRQRTAQIRQATSDAASLAAAIDILVNREAET